MINIEIRCQKDLVYRAEAQYQPKYESSMNELKQFDEKCLEWFQRVDTKKGTSTLDGVH